MCAKGAFCAWDQSGVVMVKGFRERKPWAAAVVSFVLSPSMGALYLNKVWLALAYLLLFILALLSAPLAQHFELVGANVDTALVSDLSRIGLAVIGAIHLFLLARVRSADMQPQWFARIPFLLAVWAVLIVTALGVRIFAFQPFSFNSASMSPTIQAGDYIVVDKSAYGYSRYSFPLSAPILSNRLFPKDPARGDVVVHVEAGQPSVAYLRRVIGVAGDRIQMREGRLWVNGSPIMLVEVGVTEASFGRGSVDAKILRETLPGGAAYLTLDTHLNGAMDNTAIYTVPHGHVFLMGDHRDNSRDSRTARVGFIPVGQVYGRVIRKVWDGETRKLIFEPVR